MVVRRTQLYTFLLLTLTALQQGCGTNSALQPPSTEQAQEAGKAESAGKAVAGVMPKFTEEEQKARQVPKLPPEPTQREILPESVLGAPEKDLASRGTRYDTVLLVRAFATPVSSGWQYRKNQQGKIVGFEFSNRGGNRILPYRYDIQKSLFFTRDFQFRFDDRARQDIHLFLSDWSPSRDRQFRLSELMNSVMLFFPRNYLPAIVTLGRRSTVTLPTAEEVEFDAETHEVLGGVFSEAPVDLNPDKAARKFPGIHYIGKGLAVRANGRGVDPRLGTIATVTTGSPSPNCQGRGCKSQCQVPSRELWDQNGAARFKFSTDEEFDRYLHLRCGFGVPKDSPHFMTASRL